MTFSVSNRIRVNIQNQTKTNHLRSLLGPRVFYSTGNWGSKREVVAIQGHGLHEVEWIDDKPSVWTSGDARLSCVFTRPRYVRWIAMEVDSGPVTNTLTISLNAENPFQVKTRGKQIIRLVTRNPSSHSNLMIDIQCAVFTPQLHIKKNNDPRRVGVMIREVQIAKYWWRLPMGGYNLPFQFRDWWLSFKQRKSQSVIESRLL